MDIGWYRMIWDAEASLWIFMKFVTDYLHPWEEQVLKKKAKGPHCGDCGKALIGLPRLRPIEYMRCDECPALLCLIWYIYISFQVHPESTWYCTVEQHMGHTADATPQTFLSNPSDSLRLIKSGSGSFKIYIYIGSSPVHVCRETFSEQWAWAVRITYGQLCKHQHQLAWGWSSARSEWTVPMVALVAPIACANASCVPS